MKEKKLTRAEWEWEEQRKKEIETEIEEWRTNSEIVEAFHDFAKYAQLVTLNKEHEILYYDGTFESLGRLFGALAGKAGDAK